MRYSIFGGVSTLLFSLILSACLDQGPTTRTYPVIDTEPVTSINNEGATFSAMIINAGTSEIIDHGFIYDDSPVDSSGSHVERISLGPASSTGEFHTTASRNLIKNKTYYVRGYATCKSGITVYGQEVDFECLGGTPAEIHAIIPSEFSAGDHVLLVGSGFSTIANENKIAFYHSSATILQVSEDSLWCVVPTFTPTGENSVTLTVGDAEPIVSSVKFTLLTMGLNSFTPTGNFRDTITVTGTNFPKEIVS